MRDLTSEFTQLCDAVGRSAAALPRPAPDQQQRQIVQEASAIGQAIYATTQKLAELSRLARSTTPFGDPGARIEELTFLVKADLIRVQSALAALEGTAGRAGAPGEAMVAQLNGALVDASRQFTSAMHTRTESLKKAQERRARWGGATRAGPAPVLRPDRPDLGEDSAADELAIAVPQVAADDLLLERHDQVRQIERHIGEVQGMFRRLAEVVTSQGEQISRLEDTMTEVEGHALEGHRQLLRYLQGLASDRALVLKVFGLLLFFLFLFIVFFV